ncbi:mitochondrial nicotinamide adenine dinucleotide transporter 2-like isoform X2 [Cucumis melo]|uniref:Pectinesterase n=1 Tax=Cucumis melo TaxID=3656 RepID=A0ABM3LC29_CUCME|nr:mitochondrial nicotinamide adenine dinucleotide transporter 2-like isoform X2 [Cucumis melo]XP_050947581.1 mitochondrial nicotinamide adenine dinucleotide transporter 2-like isoform X2 [Cucumis melo]
MEETKDTLYLHYGRQYLKDCYIEGSVDFIFGNSTALLEHCHVHCKSKGFITAQSRKSSQETTGYVFLRQWRDFLRSSRATMGTICKGGICLHTHGYAFRTILREEGFAALYKGIVPGLMLVSHGAIQFTVYEELRKVIANSRSKGTRVDAQSSGELLNSGDYAVLGGTSKIAAMLLTYPFQVIRARLLQFRKRNVKPLLHLVPVSNINNCLKKHFRDL